MKRLLAFAFLFLISGIVARSQNLSEPIVDEGLVFGENNGVIPVEAEWFYRQTHTDKRAWYRVSKNELPKVGRDDDPAHCFGAGNNAYLEILPDTRVTHEDKLIGGENFSNLPGKIACLHYKVKIDQPGRYYVWVRAYSTGSEDNGLHVGADGQWPESGARMQWCVGKHSWKWESRQRTESQHCGVPYQIYLDFDQAGIHEVTFSMREDGFEFDRFLLTRNRDYVPQGIGPDARVVTGKLPKPFPPCAETGETANPNSAKQPQVTGELKKWHKVTLTFDGPFTSEDASLNPFMNYRLNVLFTHKTSGKQLLIPGYFAADGNAAETSATSGNKWRVHFCPPETGEWTYEVSFRKGNFAAISEKKEKGKSAGFMDGMKGTIRIEASDKTEPDNRARGMLVYDGTRYLKYAETGKPMFKVGPDAPENFLAYVDFDGTFASDGHKDNLVKTWEAHLQDWHEGDPQWQNGKGKAIIGAINYLASKGLNSVSFLTNNIGGDDQNVFPYVDYDTYDRFDCSKLDQWEIVFDHADKLGFFLHFKTLEFENQGLLDGGAIGALTKLYYRELMARFGHHLALNWNIGEEIGDWANPPTPPMETPQRLAAATYFYEHDPYHHHVVIHNGMPFYDILGPNSHYTGISLQTNKTDFSRVHGQVLHWLKASAEAGKQWAVSCDEPGDAQHALLPDAENPDHDNARINGLWGTFMAGGWGTEWYFGYKHEHSDLSCQDYRSRDLFWDQCRIVRQFFEGLESDVRTTVNRDDLVQEGDYCLADEGRFYLVFLRKGEGVLNLENNPGKFSVRWFNPRKGGKLLPGKIQTVKGGQQVKLLGAPTEQDKDWVVILRKI